MVIILLLILVLLLVTYIYLRWIRLKQFWAERQVPHLPPHPLFGSLTFLRGENPAPWYRHVYDTFKTPYVGLWIIWRPGLLVNSAKIAQNILIRDQANFRNRFANSGNTDPVGRLNLFTLNHHLILSVHNLSLQVTRRECVQVSRSLHSRVVGEHHTQQPEVNALVTNTANSQNMDLSEVEIRSITACAFKDPLWSIIRKRLSVLFTGSKLRGVQDLIKKKSLELVERIDKERQKPEPINLRVVMTDFSTDIIGTASLGVVSDATLTGKSEIRSITEDYMKYGFFRALSWLSIFLFPELVDIFRFKMFTKESTENMRKILRMIIARRGGLEKKITEPRDLLDVLIKIKQEDDGVLEMTENMMLAQVAVFITAGFESSGLLLSFGFYELAFSPEVQDKLYREIKEAKEEHGENLLDATVLSKLTYLNCVIKEVFRKYPTLPALDRVALEDYKVDDHLTIKAGTPVFVNVLGLHYDPDIYPDPDKFNPDRFRPENDGDVKHLAFFPFGEGPRKCIGQRFGHSSIRHGMAAIVLNYEIRPLPNSPRPSEVNLDKKTVFLAPGDILSVEFVPRN